MLYLDQFRYDLPDGRIAKHPLEDRASAKLLMYHKGSISHHVFRDLPGLLPHGGFLLFNDTKVIPARLVFHKETGARIEVFLLDPVAPSNVYEEVMNSKKTCAWRVTIGNAKKWKKGQVLKLRTEGFSLAVARTAMDSATFFWESGETFSDILAKAGKVPLPPYLNREAVHGDTSRYQTVYSKHEGAVAAPTAGLHFTGEVLDALGQKGFVADYVTLHVSAGTFQPVKSEVVEDHPMHGEQVLVSRRNTLNLMEHDLVIPVGTTSMRTAESLFWYGNILETDPGAEFRVLKGTPYTPGKVVSKRRSLENVIKKMDSLGADMLIGHTEIFIYPGYQMKICKGLVTNYHLPGSTLILLVAALIGGDWKKVYQEALANGYRFLSYGDSSLLLP